MQAPISSRPSRPPDDAPGADVRVESPTVVPVIAESLAIRKEIEAVGAVRVRIEVDGVVERVGTDVVRERYAPIVNPIGLPAGERREPYVDGDDVVVPVYEERLVVERRLFLKEEIRLRRAREVEHRESEAPVRRERAVVERLQADGTWQEVRAGAPVAEHTSASPGTPHSSDGPSSYPSQESFK
jgi:stress response protein YsnF